MASKKCAIVDRTHCVACGACKKACPREAIQIWKGCYATIHLETCVGCGICTKVCPTGCLETKEREENR